MDNNSPQTQAMPIDKKDNTPPFLRGLIKLAVMVILVVVSGIPLIGLFSGGGGIVDIIRRCLELVVSVLTLGVGASVGYMLLDRFNLHGPLATVLSVVVTSVISIVLTKLLIWIIMLFFQWFGTVIGVLFAIAAFMFTFISGWGMLLTLVNITSKVGIEGKMIMQMFIHETFSRKIGG